MVCSDLSYLEVKFFDLLIGSRDFEGHKRAVWGPFSLGATSQYLKNIFWDQNLKYHAFIIICTFKVLISLTTTPYLGYSVVHLVMV